LLDVREPEQYDTWRVQGAVSYPPSQMIHASNSLPQDVYYYRAPRDSHKMVVLYSHDGGRSAIDAGNLLVQKGVDNTYVVTGGLAQFAPRFPRLLEGDVPPLTSPPAQTLASLSGGQKGVHSSKPPSTAQSVRSHVTQNTQLSGGSSMRGTPSKRGGSAWR